MVNQRKKPAKLRWTIRWRILNKKGKVEDIGRKRCVMRAAFVARVAWVCLCPLWRLILVARTRRGESEAAALQDHGV